MRLMNYELFNEAWICQAISLAMGRICGGVRSVSEDKTIQMFKLGRSWFLGESGRFLLQKWKNDGK